MQKLRRAEQSLDGPVLLYIGGCDESNLWVVSIPAPYTWCIHRSRWIGLDHWMLVREAAPNVERAADVTA